MPEPAQSTSEALATLLKDPALGVWLSTQRWYAAKSRAVQGLEPIESVLLGENPKLMLAIVQAQLSSGMHHLYQLPLSLARGDAAGAPVAFAQAGEWSARDALADPDAAFSLMVLIDAGGEIATDRGRFLFRRTEGARAVRSADGARPIGVEQSNSSVVFDDRVVLKVFRRLESGINPELELLRFLGERDFGNIAALHGWYEYEGPALAATLGIAQRFLADAVGGWELGLAEVGSDPGAFLARIADLGEVTAGLHDALATDGEDPAFAPLEPSHEWMSLMTATLDEEIQDVFSHLPADDARLEPLAGRAQEVRGRLEASAQHSLGGRLIRTHGDYHLGQTLYSGGSWVVIDFEGEPARSLSDRRRKNSALRDVAGMLRSFAYLTAAAALRGTPAPQDFEERARQAFLDTYLARIESRLLPSGEAATMNLLAIFELERAIYELQYELEHRPDWLSIPVSAITRLLEYR